MNPILYLGDDDDTRAAAYLCGVMCHFQLPYERVNGSESPDVDFESKKYSIYIISDYPSSKFLPGQMEHIVQAVYEGAGILMIGGWDSFYGKNGEYHNSPLADILPIKMSDHDDRRNSYQPLFLRKLRSHPIVDGLPWSVPPSIGGFNAITPKPSSTVLLDAVRLDVRITNDDDEVADCRNETACKAGGYQLINRATLDLKLGDTVTLSEVESVPLLVVGTYGAGKTAALATDVAPHWVGGLVDWGNSRIVQKVGNGSVDIGDTYAKFLYNLVTEVAEQ